MLLILGTLMDSPSLCVLSADVELLSAESTKASCWVNQGLRVHEEQWKEDDCTFCQCVDGEPHCTAMACKLSCQNPVKIPGECCPFCEGEDAIFTRRYLEECPSVVW